MHTGDERPTASTTPRLQPDTPVAHPGDEGQQIGPYKLLKVLGEGGFGVVWLAERREPMLQQVAVKIIKAGMDSKSVIARFEQERQALAVMDHPNVARVFDGGVTPAAMGSRPYFVMEFVKGEAITEYCDRHTLTIRQRLALFILVCEAVQHAHMKGIIHRDIKPSNVLVTVKDGRPTPKVIDFGVAKAISHTLTDKTIFTETGQLIGTPEYMSPEQAEMGVLDVDTRTDVYALGVVLYELLTGMLPFDAKDLRSKGYAEIQRIIREVDPPTPSKRLTTALDGPGAEIAKKRATERGEITRELRRELEWIPLKAMRKDRSQRYSSPESLAADAQRFLDGRALEAGPVSAMYHTRKLLRRHRALTTGAGLVTAALVLGLGGTLWAHAKAVRARQRSETIRSFVASALKSGDPLENGRLDTTIVEAMRAAAKELGALPRSGDAETMADLRVTIAEILLHNGRPEEAQPLLEAALELRRGLHGANNPDVAEALNDLGVTHRALGHDQQAEDLFRQALAIYRDQSRGDNADLAVTLSNVGTLLVSFGRGEEARPLLEESLAMNRRLHPGDHASIVNGLHDLGDALRSVGHGSDAEKLFLDALQMTERMNPGDHPLTAQCLNNVATLLSEMGKPGEAEPIFTRALAMYRRVYPQEHRDTDPGDHPRVARLMGNLGTQRVYLGRLPEGEELLRGSLAMWRRLHSGDHPEVAQGLNDLGFAMQMSGRTSEAERMFVEALQMRRRLYKSDHLLVAQSLSNLAAAQHALGQSAKAEALLAEALDIDRRLFKGSHPETAKTLHNLAMVRYFLGQLVPAEEAAREATDMYGKVYPNGHVATAESMSSLALTLYQQGKLEPARETIAAAEAMALRIEQPRGRVTQNIQGIATTIRGP